MDPFTLQELAELSQRHDYRLVDGWVTCGCGERFDSLAGYIAHSEAVLARIRAARSN